MVKQLRGDRVAVGKDAAHIVRAQTGVNRVERLGIGAFLALDNVLRQLARKRAAHDAFFPSIQRLERPRHVVSIFDNAVVAERHAHLKAGMHAHAVLAVEQGGHKPVQIEHEHLAHARVLCALAGQFGRAAAGGKVVFADKFRAVLDHAGREQPEPQVDRTRPREGILEQNLLAVIPRVAAEQLVGALAGQAHGRAAVLDRRAEQQQRRVDVGHAGQVARVGRGQQRGAQGVRLDDDVVVARAECIHHHLDKFVVAARLKAVFGKIFVVVAVVDRPCVQRFAPRGVFLGRQHGQDGRVQPAGQEAGKRHVGNQLPPRGITDQFVRAFDGLLKIVGVLARFQFPIGAVGVALGR